MPSYLFRPAAWRGLSAIAWGMTLAFTGGTDIDRLMPICAGAALCDGLLAAIAPSPNAGRHGRRDWAATVLGLVMAGLMFWQPLYSTLSYSFLLLLRWVQWQLGLGLISLLRSKPAVAGWLGPDLLSFVGAAVILLGAIALQLWPGAGMVERGLQAGLALAVWGAAALFSAARSERA